MTVEELIKNFVSFGCLSHSGELYLPVGLTERFIESCFKESIVILGIDFFHKEEDCWIPVDPINSLDCSLLLHNILTWQEKVETSYNFAKKVLFLEKLKDDAQWCSLVLLDKANEQ